YEHFLTGHARAAHTLTDSALVAIGLGSVDAAIADISGGADGVCGVTVVNEPGAQSQLRDVNTIGQSIGLVEDSHAFLHSYVYLHARPQEHADARPYL